LIPFDSEPGHLFRVNARHLHQKLEVGRDFATWIQDRIKKFQLIEGKDYKLETPDLGNQVRGWGGARRTTDYMLTTHTARILSADVGTPVGREVIKYLVARDEQLTEQETLIRVPTTMSVILQLEAP
jgi:anti-repressor protein